MYVLHHVTHELSHVQPPHTRLMCNCDGVTVMGMSTIQLIRRKRRTGGMTGGDVEDGRDGRGGGDMGEDQDVREDGSGGRRSGGGRGRRRQ